MSLHSNLKRFQPELNEDYFHIEHDCCGGILIHKNEWIDSLEDNARYILGNIYQSAYLANEARDRIQEAYFSPS